MKALIEVSNNVMGSKEVQSVLARELYLGLGLSEINWSAWSETNIVENDFFAENVDWTRFLLNKNRTNGLPIKDFIVSLDFSKHIAMMAKTEKAHEYRNYFLDCERQVQAKPLTQLEMLAQAVLAQVEQERRLVTNEQKVTAIEEKIELLEVDLRNGVPQGFLSKSNAHKHFGKGLSKAIFEATLLQYAIPTQNYVHSENGHSTSTFAYKENEIETIIDDFISDAEQVTSNMCYSKLLNKRFSFIKAI